VAAVVSVAGLGAEIRRIIRTEARQLLAADIAFSSRQEPPTEWKEFLDEHPDYVRAGLRELVALSAAPPRAGQVGASQLVELKVVDGPYPFYGELGLDPASALEDLLDAETTIVAPDLLQRLGLSIGDELLLGGTRFEIVGTVLSEPDRIGGSFSLGPRVFLAAAGLERTNLIGFGSRVLHKELLKLPADLGPDEIQAVSEEIEERLPATGLYRVETYVEAQPSLQRGLRRVERFLGLVALLSLLIGGVGVAQTVRAWLASRIDAIATLRCIGLRPNEVVWLYLGHTLLLGLIGSLLGIALGLLVQWIVPQMLADLLPGRVTRLWHWSAVAKGLGLGIGVATLFSLPPLLATRRVSPARVFRRDAEPIPARRRIRVALAVLIAAGVWLTATIQADSPVLGAGFTASLLVAVGFLTLAAYLMAKGAARLPSGMTSIWLRHGLGALGRPGAGTIGAVVSLGLGVLVVLAITQVEDGVSEELETALPTDAPSAFLIDIQTHQWEGVEALLNEEQASRIDSVPVVSARLTEVGGRTIEELLEEAGDDRGKRWALTREQRLTYLSELPEDNEILEGELWARDEVAEVSIEQEFAEDLGVGVGDRLGFSVQGVPFDLEVTSIRKVDWETFGINFFLVVEPGVLDEAPQFRLAAARLPADREQNLQNRLAAGFPNVTMLRIQEVLDKVRSALERLGVGVRFLGGFTMIAGLIILAGAVSAGTVRRGREVAVLKTLGVTRLGVIAIFSIEYALIGLAAGLIGTLGSHLLAWATLTRAMEVTWRWSPSYLLTGPAICMVLSVVAGIVVSWGALTKRPIEALRQE
jgi:putative ABC transport system permease protein